MGGYGSGRWGSHTRKPTTDEVQVLRVKDVAAKVKGTAAERGAFVLSTGDGQEVRVRRVPIPRGGVRFYLLCPKCGAQRVNLYVRRGVFACRVCHRLTYTSSLECHKFDGLFKHLAAELGGRFTPREIKASLSGRYSGKTLAAVDAALSGGKEMTRAMNRMNRKKGKT